MVTKLLKDRRGELNWMGACTRHGGVTGHLSRTSKGGPSLFLAQGSQETYLAHQDILTLFASRSHCRPPHTMGMTMPTKRQLANLKRGGVPATPKAPAKAARELGLDNRVKAIA